MDLYIVSARLVMNTNGPAVWLGAVCVAVPSFLPVPGDGRVVSGHGEAARRYPVQIDGSEVSCHDEIVSVPSKKRGTSASAYNPIDFVSAVGTVRVQQDFISWN